MTASQADVTYWKSTVLRNLSKKTGVPVSVLLRRAIAAWLDANEGKPTKASPPARYCHTGAEDSKVPKVTAEHQRDATPFRHRDGVVEAEWRIITPIEEAWAHLPATDQPRGMFDGNPAIQR